MSQEALEARERHRIDAERAAETERDLLEVISRLVLYYRRLGI
jgi:hypothetical protein